MISILFIGDIVGKPGRRAVREVLKDLRARSAVDFVIANAENAAGGSGVTPEIIGELLDCGVHVFTSGDHIWRNRAVHNIIGREMRLLRPANYPPESPGQGSVVIESQSGVKIGVINAVGRVFMNPSECPFHAIIKELNLIKDEARVIIVDFHAEATSEKIAMGRYLDGKVTAVIGTHTHVPTADEKILPGGTAYITDVGMTGPADSVLGREVEPVIVNFITRIPQRFNVAKGDAELHGVLIKADEKTGKAIGIERVTQSIET